MKTLGKIALIFAGCFLLFAVIGNIALSFNGGIQASFQQVSDRLEEVFPYELFSRAEESLDQIEEQLEAPQKTPSSAPSGSSSGSSSDSPSNAGNGSSGSQGAVSDQDAYQIPIGDLREIDVKAQGCSVEIAPGDPGSQISAVLERKNDEKIQLDVHQEKDELKIRAIKRGLLPSTGQDAVLTIRIPSDYRGDFSFEGDACSVTLQDINFSREIDLELSACDVQGSNLQGTEISISASTATISLSGIRGKLELEQSLGDTSLIFSEIIGEIEVENNLGNVDLYFPPNSPIQINSASSLGEIHRNLQRSGSGQVDGPLYEVEISASMGSVSLNDAE